MHSKTHKPKIFNGNGMSIWKSANFEIVGRIAKHANFKLQKLKADVFALLIDCIEFPYQNI
jgi:hypothetical protein